MNYHEISADIRKRGVLLDSKVPPQMTKWHLSDGRNVVATIEACGHGHACEIARQSWGKRWFLKYRIVAA